MTLLVVPWFRVDSDRAVGEFDKAGRFDARNHGVRYVVDCRCGAFQCFARQAGTHSFQFGKHALFVAPYVDSESRNRAGAIDDAVGLDFAHDVGAEAAHDGVDFIRHGVGFLSGRDRRCFGEMFGEGGNVQAPTAGDFLCARHATAFERMESALLATTDNRRDGSGAPNEFRVGGAHSETPRGSPLATKKSRRRARFIVLFSRRASRVAVRCSLIPYGASRPTPSRHNTEATDLECSHLARAPINYWLLTKLPFSCCQFCGVIRARKQVPIQVGSDGDVRMT